MTPRSHLVPQVPQASFATFSCVNRKNKASVPAKPLPEGTRPDSLYAYKRLLRKVRRGLLPFFCV
jgi:hypothetical protein